MSEMSIISKLLSTESCFTKLPLASKISICNTLPGKSFKSICNVASAGLGNTLICAANCGTSFAAVTKTT